MSMMTKLAILGAGVAAIAASPASAQYYQRGYAQPYGYAQNYGYGQAYGAMNTNVATQQCTAAVQSRLYNRQNIGGILGVLLGANTSGRVLSVTQVTPRNNGLVRVRGLASSGRYAGYGAYGVGAYGALGYGQPDLSFKCDVDYRGYVRDVDITRRY